MAVSRGPVPKRSDQRRHREKPEVPIETAIGAAEVVVPDPDPDWHPIASRWFVSLAESGQSVFYEPSDWATAFLIAESMSRDLSPQFVGINEKSGEVEKDVIPLKGASLAAYLKAMSVLLVTEGDRRRARVELMRPVGEEDEAGVSELADYRRKLQSG